MNDDALHELNERMRFMEREGYRKCDIPACNCGSWHGGRAYKRLAEVIEQRDEAEALLLWCYRKCGFNFVADEECEIEDLLRKRDLLRFPEVGK